MSGWEPCLWSSARQVQVALTAEKSATETVSGDVRRSDDQSEVDRGKREIDYAPGKITVR